MIMIDDTAKYVLVVNMFRLAHVGASGGNGCRFPALVNERIRSLKMTRLDDGATPCAAAKRVAGSATSLASLLASQRVRRSCWTPT